MLAGVLLLHTGTGCVLTYEYMTLTCVVLQDWSGQKTPNTATYRNYIWKIPVYPLIASTPTYIARTFANGTINSKAIMVSDLALTLESV